MLTLAVTYAGFAGGAERTLLDFARGLPGDVAVACPEGELAAAARAESLRVLPIKERSLELRGGAAGRANAGLALAGHAREIARLARATRPDLLLAWGMRSAMAAPPALALTRPGPALLVRHVDFLPGPLIARLVRAAAARADHVSVNSQAVAEDLDPAGRLGGRLSVISPGVDLSRYDPGWAPGADPEVLLLGAVEPWKRPDLALEAVARAAETLPRLRLTVAGAPVGAAGERLAAALRERAARPDLAGRVTFAGRLDDPRDALRHAWALLHCADREPFGSVVLQALASGRPVVAPAAGGPAEVVDEACGRLYRPRDPTAAAEALVEVLASEDEARRRGAAGRERAADFDAGDARRRFAEVAGEAVRARGRGAAARP